MPEYFKPPNIFTVNDSFNWQETNRLVILKIGLGVDLGTTEKQIQRVVRRLGDGTAVSTWSFEPREGLALCNAKAVPSSLSYFKYWFGPRNRTLDLPLCRPALYD